jgi:hypothetical protein
METIATVPGVISVTPYFFPNAFGDAHRVAGSQSSSKGDSGRGIADTATLRAAGPNMITIIALLDQYEWNN